MKTLTRIVIGVVIVEVILAIYNVPVASLPMIIAASTGALFFMVMGKVLFAVLADRKDERAAFVTLQRNTSEDYRYTVTALSLQQRNTVEAMLQMGALLTVTPNGRPAAQLPGGPALTISPVEADYWQEIAPGQVAGYLGRGY